MDNCPCQARPGEKTEEERKFLLLGHKFLKPVPIKMQHPCQNKNAGFPDTSIRYMPYKPCIFFIGRIFYLTNRIFGSFCPSSASRLLKDRSSLSCKGAPSGLSRGAPRPGSCCCSSSQGPFL